MATLTDDDRETFNTSETITKLNALTKRLGKPLQDEMYLANYRQSMAVLDILKVKLITIGIIRIIEQLLSHQTELPKFGKELP